MESAFRNPEWLISSLLKFQASHKIYFTIFLTFPPMLQPRYIITFPTHYFHYFNHCLCTLTSIPCALPLPTPYCGYWNSPPTHKVSLTKPPCLFWHPSPPPCPMTSPEILIINGISDNRSSWTTKILEVP